MLVAERGSRVLRAFVGPAHPGRERAGRVGVVVANWRARGGRVEIVRGGTVETLGPP